MLTSPRTPAQNRFAALQLAAVPGRLTESQADALIKTLVDRRWARLSSEYDDPLGLLFANRVKQWTAGWSPDGAHLYLLVWELHSWQEKAVWSLYDNGHLVFREADGTSGRRAAALHKLLESPELPFISQAGLLEPLTHPATVEAMLATLTARPEVFAALESGLFALLEAGLGRPDDWPVLDVMKLGFYERKNPLVLLFKVLNEQGFLRTPAQLERLDRALNALESDYRLLELRISPLMQDAFARLHQAYRAAVTDGPWRVRLKFAVQIESGAGCC